MPKGIVMSENAEIKQIIDPINVFDHSAIKHLAGAIKIASKAIQEELTWADHDSFEPGNVLQAIAFLEQKIEAAKKSLIICLPENNPRKVVDTAH